MSEYFDANSARKRFELLSNEALIQIAYGDDSAYVQDALDLARAELARRGINSESDPVVTHAKGDHSENIQAYEQEPLPISWKIICVLFPGFLFFFLIAWYIFTKRKQATNDVIIWTIYGILFWLSIGLIKSMI